MKPFNLERALAGDPVRCRDESIKVLRLIHMPELKRLDCLIVIYRIGKFEKVGFWYPTGGRLKDYSNDLDLFMDAKKVTKFINIFKQENDHLTSHNILWDDKAKAEEHGRKFQTYHSTVPVEIEL